MFALKWIHTRIMSFETDSYYKGGSSSVHAPAIQHAIRNRQLFLRWVKLCVSTCNPAPSELKLIIIIIIIPLLSLFIIHIFIYSSIYLFIYLFIYSLFIKCLVFYWACLGNQIEISSFYYKTFMKTQLKWLIK